MQVITFLKKKEQPSDMQPFSYQQSSHSCWITSLHNALIYFLKDKNNVPQEISKKIYMNSSETGVPDQSVLKILETIKDFANVHIKIFRENSITQKLITRHLSDKGTVMLCDTQSGRHSVLVTDLSGDEIIAFDPNWNNVKDSQRQKKMFACSPYGDPEEKWLNSHKNVSIHLDYFFKQKTGKNDLFTMGRMADRFAIFLKH